MTATDVEIAGVGIHPFGRFDGMSVTEMGVAAVRASLAEAGVGRGGFQAAFCGTAYGGVAAGHKVLDALGIAPQAVALRSDLRLGEDNADPHHPASLTRRSGSGTKEPQRALRG